MAVVSCHLLSGYSLSLSNSADVNLKFHLNLQVVRIGHGASWCELY